MTELLTGFQTSAAIGAIARLGVADALADGPARPQELAARLGADARSLARVMAALLDVGVFEAHGDGRYGLTALGELLRSDVEGSARRAAVIGTDEWCWRAYGHISHSLRTAEPGFYPAHGCDFWQYLAAHPEEAAAFNEVMSSSSRLRAEAFAGSYDFSGIERLVDVGGGQGVLLRTVLAAHPHLRGVLFDLPAVIAEGRVLLSEASLAERCEMLAGDFFERVPSGGDAYLLSWIVHDWDDRAATHILANTRAALGDGGRLLLIEMVLPSGDETAGTTAVEKLAKAMDLQMLVLTGGRERTAAEYRQLLAGGGFRLARVLPLEGTLWSVIEGVPA
jgi:O-methyltransferase domain